MISVTRKLESEILAIARSLRTVTIAPLEKGAPGILILFKYAVL
jgi:hypothetical protein